MSTAPSGGFIRVACTVCNNPDVWFKCNECGKSDHFTLGEESVSCSCGESYSSGVCTCGETVPFVHLKAVPYDQGPLALADLEVAWGRVGALVLAAVLVISTVVFFLVGS